VDKNDDDLASATASQGRLTRRLSRTGAESHLATNRTLGKMPYRRYRAERRDLLDRDAMSGRYSSQEYHADEKLLDIVIESGYVYATSS
jgi:hypothetical protein